MASVTSDCLPSSAWQALSAKGWQCQRIGLEQTALLVLDNFHPEPQLLKQQALLCRFAADASNFYPGVRAVTPVEYQQHLLSLLPVLRSSYAPDASHLQLLLSAFALACTPATQLKPIQMLPHFDAVSNLQLAMVHYLCDEPFGGTAFYRHQTTQFERITTERLPVYGQQLKQQAMAARLHEKPQYMAGDSVLFQQIAYVPAKFNRLVIYPGNLLHSGVMNGSVVHTADPNSGRLTVSSFLQLR